MGRRLGATSVVALLVLAGLFIGGMSLAWAAISVTLYETIETDLWDPWAPGPSGVTYSGHNTMYVVDTDRNNYPEFAMDGVDIWEINLDGTVVRSWGLDLASTEEPTGIDYDPVGNRMFVTNDDGDYHIFLPGTDGMFGTGDDPAPSSPISVAGSDDTEDPVYDPVTNHLYVLNGGSSGRIYVLNPTTGASVAPQIPLTSLGPTDWEGLTMTPNGELLVGANLTQQIFVLEKDGNYLETISVSVTGLERISGLGISPPGGGGSGYDIWVADRQGTCNCDEPANIDGRLWRLSTSGAPPATTTTTGGGTTTTTGATTTTTGATTTTTGGGTTTTSPTTTTLPGNTTTTTTPPPPPPPPAPTATTAAVQTNAGLWRLYRGPAQVAQFFYGNPGDYGFMGDWNGDGIDTPGLYRRSDGYVYLRNSNTQGVAEIAFFFGNPGDLPLAGDFDGDGRDTVSIYRPSEGKFYIMNHLGSGDAGLGAADYSYYFGNPGDAPFMGDWNADGIDTPGLRRNSDGFVYLRHSNTQGPGQVGYSYGNSGDLVFTGDWDEDGDDTLGLYRPSNGTVYLRNTNTTGNADSTLVIGGGMQPTGGHF